MLFSENAINTSAFISSALQETLKKNSLTQHTHTYFEIYIGEKRFSKITLERQTSDFFPTIVH